MYYHSECTSKIKTSTFRKPECLGQLVACLISIFDILTPPYRKPKPQQVCNDEFRYNAAIFKKTKTQHFIDARPNFSKQTPNNLRQDIPAIFRRNDQFIFGKSLEIP